MSTTEKIMSIAQEYASAWSLVGSRFDNGHGMEYAEEARAALLKAVEEMAADAARYAWLRDSNNFEPGWWSGNADFYDLDDFDAAIDAAMQKETP